MPGRNPANGREVVVRVNDRGPFHADRVIDLSYTRRGAAGALGGVAPVEVERPRTRPSAPAPGPVATLGLAAGAAARGRGAADPIAEIARGSAAVVVPAPPPAHPGRERPPAPSATGFWLQLGPSASPMPPTTGGAPCRASWIGCWAGQRADRRPLAPGAGRTVGQLQRGLAAADRLRELLRLAPVLIERTGP